MSDWLLHWYFLHECTCTVEFCTHTQRHTHACSFTFGKFGQFIRGFVPLFFAVSVQLSQLPCILNNMFVFVSQIKARLVPEWAWTHFISGVMGWWLINMMIPSRPSLKILSIWLFQYYVIHTILVCVYIHIEWAFNLKFFATFKLTINTLIWIIVLFVRVWRWKDN